MINLKKVLVAVTAGALSLAVLGSTAGAALANPTCTIGTSTISQCFPSAPLADAVAKEAGHGVNQQLTQADVAKIRTLAFAGASVDSLQGLQYLTNLTYLNFGNNNVSDVTALQGLTKLTYLDFPNNTVSDVTALQGLTKLTHLAFSGNKVSDVAPLKGMVKLDLLDFSRNQVSDISALQGLTKLSSLFFDRNQVSDITAVKGLVNLTDLRFSSNIVSDIAPVQGLAKLGTLFFDGNQVSDITAVHGLTKLTVLHFDNNRVSDIAPLHSLANLSLLSLVSNQVSDVAPLAGLANLSLLSLASNRVSDVAPLHGLSNLAYLYLQFNHISDLTALRGLTKMAYAIVDNQSVTLPAVIGSQVSVGTAVDVAGAYVTPMSINPPFGTYDAAAGKVTWTGLRGQGNAGFTAHGSTSVGSAKRLNYTVTFTQPYTSPSKYLVSFDSRGGSSVASQSVTQGNAVIRPTDPVREGYSFTGWNTKANGSGTEYDFSAPVTGNLTLYAQWKTAAVDPASQSPEEPPTGSSLATTGGSSAWIVGIGSVLAVLAAGIFVVRRLRSMHS